MIVGLNHFPNRFQRQHTPPHMVIFLKHPIFVTLLILIRRGTGPQFQNQLVSDALLIVTTDKKTIILLALVVGGL